MDIINTVCGIESTAYGVLFTSCLCQKPERARYERVRARLHCYITRRTFYILLLLDWFATRNTEVRLFVTDSPEHAFNMNNCFLKSVLNFSDIESRM